LLRNSLVLSFLGLEKISAGIPDSTMIISAIVVWILKFLYRRTIRQICGNTVPSYV
jgi:hypothetical protein